MTHKRLAMAIALALAAAVSLGAVIHTSIECHSTGGTIVRGLIWLECI